jgi:hypothetical protein
MYLLPEALPAVADGAPGEPGVNRAEVAGSRPGASAVSWVRSGGPAVRLEPAVLGGTCGPGTAEDRRLQ